MPAIKDLNTLSQAELASLWGISTRTIQRSPDCETLRHGTGQGCYYVWDECRDRKPGSKAPFVASEDGSDKARKERAEADLMEMKRDALAGTLLEAEDVRRTWGESLANMRAKLLSLPAKAAVQIEDGATLAEREDVIRSVVYEALEELSGRMGGEGGANA